MMTAGPDARPTLQRRPPLARNAADGFAGHTAAQAVCGSGMSAILSSGISEPVTGEFDPAPLHGTIALHLPHGGTRHDRTRFPSADVAFSPMDPIRQRHPLAANGRAGPLLSGRMRRDRRQSLRRPGIAALCRLPAARRLPWRLRLPLVCRPAGWIAIWRRLGQMAVLSRRLPLVPA